MMTLLIASNFDEASGDVINYGSAGNWSLTGSTVVRTASGHTNGGVVASGAGTAAHPPNVGQTSARTMMCWLKGPLPSLDWPAQYYNSTDDTGLWGILIQSGQIRFRGRDASAVIGIAGATIPSDMNTVWHHVAGTYDNANIRMYLDGTLMQTTPFTGIRTDGVLEVLGYPTATSMDDFRVYDTALSAGEIVTAMNTPPGPVSPSVPEALIWSGSAWVGSSMRYYSGSAWSAS